MRTLLTFIAFFIGTADLFACKVCMGDPESPMMQGMSNGILFLLVIIAGVLAAFGAFFVYIKRRGEIAQALETA